MKHSFCLLTAHKKNLKPQFSESCTKLGTSSTFSLLPLRSVHRNSAKCCYSDLAESISGFLLKNSTDEDSIPQAMPDCVDVGWKWAGVTLLPEYSSSEVRSC